MKYILWAFIVATSANACYLGFRAFGVYWDAPDESVPRTLLYLPGVFAVLIIACSLYQLVKWAILTIAVKTSGAHQHDEGRRRSRMLLIGTLIVGPILVFGMVGVCVAWPTQIPANVREGEGILKTRDDVSPEARRQVTEGIELYKSGALRVGRRFVLEHLRNAGIFEAIIFGFALILSFFFPWTSSGATVSREFIRGSKFMYAMNLAEKLGTLKNTGFFKPKYEKTEDAGLFAGVPLPRDLETGHVLILGSTGAGKSTLLKLLLNDLLSRRSGNVFIYDPKPEFISAFYRNSSSTIINFSDSRSAKWNIFGEIRRESYMEDIDFIAKTLIASDNERERFWIQGAQIIFKAVLATIYEKEENPTNRTLARFLLKHPGPRMVKEITNPVLKNQVNLTFAGNGEVGLDTLRTLEQYIEVFKLPQLYEDGDFSMRRWIKEGQGTLFLVNTPDMEKYYRQLYGLLIEIGSSAVLSLDEDVNRRIYFVIDEFQTFANLRSLVDLLKRGRSKGASVILASQEYNLQARFWRDNEQAVFNNTRTKVCFSLADDKTAEKMAKVFGMSQYVEHRTSVTDGGRSSYTKGIVNDYVILPSELMNLPKFRYIVGVHGVGVAVGEISYREFPRIAANIERKNEQAVKAAIAQMRNDVAETEKGLHDAR